MIDSVLTAKNVSVKGKIGIKTALAAVFIALAVALPQLVHLALGAPGGVEWLPMYLPVLLAGCLLGFRFGLAVGLLSPVVSFALTSVAGNAMPQAARLPFMVVELAVFAAVSGLFSRHIVNNRWLAFPAVLLAQVAGRSVFLLSVFLFQSVSPLTVELVWTQIKTGLLGMVLQAVVVPLLVMAAARLMQKDA